MNGRAITIADKDGTYRSRMANYFQKAGYHVRTVVSAEQALESVLGKETSVLLLGSNIAESASMADLIHLLKHFNSRLQIIMVSEEMTLAETRQVREAGIFYHALKPAAASDTDEIRQAVTCAYENWLDQAAPLKSQPAPAAATAPPRSGRVPIGKALSWFAGVVALTFAAGVLSLQAKPAHSGSSLAIWIFLGFVALILTNQFLPIFRVKLALESLKEWRAARSGAHRGGR